MKKLQFKTRINASPDSVWTSIVEGPSYQRWSSVFDEGTRFEGAWEKGKKIRFVEPSEEGGMKGMLAVIDELRPREYISIKMIGYVKNDQEITEGPDVESQLPTFENYTLQEIDGETVFQVEVEVSDDQVPFFEEKWPQALEKLKEVSEEKAKP